MDIYELHERSKVSLRSLQKLHKLGALLIDKEVHPIYCKAQNTLRQGHVLTAEQLLFFHTNPEWIDRMGRHEIAVRAALQELGDVEADQASRDIGAETAEAAMVNPQSIERIATWLSDMIDTSAGFDNRQEQGHAFVAVRLLADVPGDLWQFNVPHVSKALYRVRAHDLMQGRFRIDERKRVQYRRPPGS